MKKEKEKESQAVRIRNLMQKQKGLLKASKSLVDFKEPVMFLHRRNGQMEFYENVTAGKFGFKHSSGEDRVIELRPADQETFEYAGRRIRMYDAHEDYPFAGREDPVVDSEIIALSQEKTLNAVKKYEESVLKAKTGHVKGWFIGIAILVGAIALALVIIPRTFWDAVFNKGGGQVAQQAAENVPIVGGLVLMKLKQRFK